ncbi:hypothetical protein CGLAMM_04785 [Acetobacteraceae bacterium EV16G]|uniref:Uncharacterized protein n=1 Tax=Sorlinia euscelidii TaxID=3081148 RepID=A0ABU7U0S7_9PROT
MWPSQKKEKAPQTPQELVSSSVELIEAVLEKLRKEKTDFLISQLEDRNVGLTEENNVLSKDIGRLAKRVKELEDKNQNLSEFHRKIHFASGFAPVTFLLYEISRLSGYVELSIKVLVGGVTISAIAIGLTFGLKFPEKFFSLISQIKC